MTEEAKKAIKKTLEKKLAAQKISYDNVRDQTKKQIQTKAPDLKADEVDDLLKQYTITENSSSPTVNASSDWDV